MIQYKFYIHQMLSYMEHIFYQINQTKEVFKNARQTDTMI